MYLPDPIFFIGGETLLNIDQEHNIHLGAALPAYKFELPCGGKYAENRNDIFYQFFDHLIIG